MCVMGSCPNLRDSSDPLHTSCKLPYLSDPVVLLRFQQGKVTRAAHPCPPHSNTLVGTETESSASERCPPNSKILRRTKHFQLLSCILRYYILSSSGSRIWLAGTFVSLYHSSCLFACSRMSVCLLVVGILQRLFLQVTYKLLSLRKSSILIYSVKGLVQTNEWNQHGNTIGPTVCAAQSQTCSTIVCLFLLTKQQLTK